MRRIFETVAVTAAIAFAVHAIGVQTARAEPPSVVSPHASPDIKPKRLTRAHGPKRLTRAHGRTHGKDATATTGLAPAADPVFLSDAWLKQEKQTDERLRRFMNICKGC